MAIHTERNMTVEDYLAWEERQEIKHEYIDGEIYEMTGSTGDHSKIAIASWRMARAGAVIE